MKKLKLNIGPQEHVRVHYPRVCGKMNTQFVPVWSARLWAWGVQ